MSRRKQNRESFIFSSCKTANKNGKKERQDEETSDCKHHITFVVAPYTLSYYTQGVRRPNIIPISPIYKPHIYNSDRSRNIRLSEHKISIKIIK